LQQCEHRLRSDEEEHGEGNTSPTFAIVKRRQGRAGNALKGIRAKRQSRAEAEPNWHGDKLPSAK
jgi:hypothetical protein